MSVAGLPGITAARQVRVTARPTIFVARDNSNTLVRFQANDTDAPAGRLRISDGSGVPIGTSGMLRSGDALHGEFWLRIDRPRDVVTELVLPGAPSALRSRHRLEPAPRWSVYWLSGLDIEELATKLNGLGSLKASIAIEELRTLGTRINPMPASLDAPGDEWDIMDRFRAVEVRALEMGLRLSNAPFVRNLNRVPTTLPRIVSAAGFSYLSVNVTSGFINIEGSTRSTIGALGADLSIGPNAPDQGDLAVRLESAVNDLELAGSERDFLVLMDTVAGDARGKKDAADTWNARYLSPRIEFDPPTLDPPDGAGTVILNPRSERVPDLTTAALIGEEHRRFSTLPVRQLQDSMAAALDADTDAPAGSIATSIPGTFVHNASPFARSEYVETDDASFMASDVPPNGYAFFPDVIRPQSVVVGARVEMTSSSLSVRLDPDTGNIASVVKRSDGTECAGRGGLNVVPHASLVSSNLVNLAGVGYELRTERWSSERGRIQTTIRTYESTDYLDIINTYEEIGRRAIQTEFNAQFAAAAMAREVPLGVHVGAQQTRPLQAGRWAALLDTTDLGSTRNALVVNADSATHVSAEGSTLRYHGPAGRQRFRLHFRRGYLLERQLYEIGRGFDPMMSWHASGGGDSVIPSYGSLLSLDRAEIVIARIRPGPDVRSLDVFMRDLAENGGPVRLDGGLLQYRSWLPLSPTGAPLGTEPPQTGVAELNVPPSGLAAVRLSGVSFR